MARIVLISPYLKGGQNAAKLAQRTRYVATRPGVELLADERSTLPATKKQRDFIWSRWDMRFFSLITAAVLGRSI